MDGPLRSLAALAAALWLGAGGAAGAWWWDRRPPHTPSLTARLLFWRWTWTAPDSLAAQLKTLRADEVAATARAQALRAEAAKIAHRFEARARAEEARRRAIDLELKKEIRDAIPASVDLAYRLPLGFVRVHDAAALGRDLSGVPRSAGQPDDAAARIATSDAAAVIAANYGDCRADAAQLDALQAWIRAQSALELREGR
jgi:hypothetical protein